MKNLSEINTATPEGVLLMTALAVLTVSEKVTINKTDINGRKTEPDEMLQLLVTGAQQAFPEMWEALPADLPAEPRDLQSDIADAINRVSRENGSNTPDFILAQYLMSCLSAFEIATKAREQWYGKPLSIWMDSADSPSQSVVMDGVQFTPGVSLLPNEPANEKY